MKINRALLAIALALPLVGTAVAASTGTAYKYVCGKYEVITYLSGVITVNKAKMDDFTYQRGANSTILMFREYMPAGGSSTVYQLESHNDGDAVLYHQWTDADDNPKGEVKVDACAHVREVHLPYPTEPSMGEIRASEG